MDLGQCGQNGVCAQLPVVEEVKKGVAHVKEFLMGDKCVLEVPRSHKAAIPMLVKVRTSHPS